MLVVGTATLPIGYYTALRWVVTIAAILTAYVAFVSNRQPWPATAWGYVGVAILFNPLAPVYLSRGTWLPIDLVAAAVMIVGCIPEVENAAS